MRLAPTIAALILAGCTTFPELDGTVDPSLRGAPYPDLVPLSGLLAQADAGTNRGPEIEADMTSRIAALRARAAGLRGAVIPASVRARMLGGVNTAALR